MTDDEDAPVVEVVDLDEGGQPVVASRVSLADWSDDPGSGSPAPRRRPTRVGSLGAAHLALLVAGLAVLATGAATATVAARPGPAQAVSANGVPEEQLSLTRDWVLRRMWASADPTPSPSAVAVPPLTGGLGPLAGDETLLALLPASLTLPDGTRWNRGTARPVLPLPAGGTAAVSADYGPTTGTSPAVRVLLISTSASPATGFSDVLDPFSRLVEQATGVTTAPISSSRPTSSAGTGFAGESVTSLTLAVVSKDLSRADAVTLLAQVEASADSSPYVQRSSHP